MSSLPRISSHNKQQRTAAGDDYTSHAQRAARSALLLRPGSSAAAAADALDDDDATASIGRFGDSAAQFGAAASSTATSAPHSVHAQFRPPQPPPAAAAAAAQATEQASAASSSSAAAAAASFPAEMHSVRSLHSSVQSTLGSIQSKTSGILITQERDLLRSFRDRLASISEELEMERKKNESGSAEWVNRCRKLTGELDFVRELTESLSTENKTLLSENRRAARIASTQEADRAFLIKQLVSIKKENARLRFMVEQQITENAELQQMQMQQGGGQAQLMPPAGLSPTPPAAAAAMCGLTQHALAAHNNAGAAASGGNNAVPRMKFQSIHNPPHSQQPALASPRGPLQQQALNLFPQAPANMRAAILAAATTESGFNDRVASAAGGVGGGGGHFLASGSKSARSATAQPHQPLPESRLAAGQEARFKSVIASLKRRLDQEVSSHRAARAAYVSEVQGRTQLQHLFKHCVDAVRAQRGDKRNLALRSPRSGGAGGGAGLSPANASIPLSTAPPSDPRLVALGDLSEGDKLAIIEWMLSEHSVMLLLFDRIWPVPHQQQQHPGSGGGGGMDLSASFGGGGSGGALNAVPLHYSYGSFIPSSSASASASASQQPSPQHPQYPSYASHFSSQHQQHQHQSHPPQQPPVNQSQLHGTHEITPSLKARTGGRLGGGGGGGFDHYGGSADDRDDGGEQEQQQEDDDGTVTHSPVVSPRALAQAQAKTSAQADHPELPLTAGRRAAPMQVQQLLSGGGGGGGGVHRKHPQGGGQEYKEKE